MKSNNFTSFVTALVIGLIIGAGGLGLIWHNSLKNPVIDPKIQKIMHSSYKSPLYLTGHVKTEAISSWCICLFTDQYNAMTKLLQMDPSIIGFKLCIGLSDDGREIIIVTGLDSHGTPVTSVPSIDTPVEPCPPNCDDTIPVATY
jgi:hypothetical protein